jgi:hypothetical protein
LICDDEGEDAVTVTPAGSVTCVAFTPASELPPALAARSRYWYVVPATRPVFE